MLGEIPSTLLSAYYLRREFGQAQLGQWPNGNRLNYEQVKQMQDASLGSLEWGKMDY